MLVFSLILKDYFEKKLILEKKISRQQKYAADNQSSNLLLTFIPELPFSVLGLLILEEGYILLHGGTPTFWQRRWVRK